MNEIKSQQDAARGARAKALLENELLNEAFAGLEAAYIKAWRETHVMDQPGREKLFIAVGVVGKVKQHLEQIVSNGNLAAKELAELAGQAERKKRFGIV